MEKRWVGEETSKNKHPPGFWVGTILYSVEGWLDGRPRRQGEEEGQLGEIRDEGKGYPGNLSN